MLKDSKAYPCPSARLLALHPRIHVLMRLAAPEETREKVERVHATYPMSCPLYRTLHHTIQLTSPFELVAS
jgi:hypothetical protein